MVYDFMYFPFAISYIILGVWVLSQYFSDRAHQYFFGFCLAFGAWALSTGLAYTIYNLPDYYGLETSRFVYASGLFIFLFAFLFFQHFPQKINRSRSINCILIGFTVITSLIALFSPLIVESLEHNNVLEYAVEVPGSAYGIYALNYIALFILSAIAITRQYRKSIALNKTRMILIVVGYLFLAVYTGVFLIALPLFEQYFLQREATLFGIPFLLLTAYAMQQYRFMKAQIILTSLLVRLSQYALSIAGGIVSYVAAQAFFRMLRHQERFTGIAHLNLDHVAFVIGLFAGLACFSFAQFFLQKYFKKHSEELQKIEQQFHNRISFTHDRKELEEILQQTFQRHFRIQNLKLLEAKKMPKLKQLFEKSSLSIFLQDKVFLATNRHKISTELISEIHKKAPSYYVYVPVFQQNDVTHILMVSEKPFSDPFRQDEFFLIQSIAKSTATALKNIELQKNLQQWNKQLQQQVAERTQDIEQKKEKIEKLYQQQSDFVMVATHELRTPLTLALLQAECLKDERASKKVKTGLENVYDAMTRLNNLMRSLFSVQQHDLDKIVSHFEPIDMHEMIEEIQQNFRHACAHKEITVSFVSNIEPETVMCIDPQQIRQVFYNIMSNAVRFTPHQGKMRLTAEHDQAKNIVRFIIDDSGPGIGPEKRQIIFEKFATSKGEKVGIGLGLYIVKKIVGTHDGEIAAHESDLGGLCISFTICSQE